MICRRCETYVKSSTVCQACAAHLTCGRFIFAKGRSFDLGDEGDEEEVAVSIQCGHDPIPDPFDDWRLPFLLEWTRGRAA